MLTGDKTKNILKALIVLMRTNTQICAGKKSLVRCNLIGPSSNSRSEKWLIDRFN